MSVSMPETASAGRDGCAATQLRRSARQRENNKISPPSPPKREQKKERRMGGRGGGIEKKERRGHWDAKRGRGKQNKAKGQMSKCVRWKGSERRAVEEWCVCGGGNDITVHYGSNCL